MILDACAFVGRWPHARTRHQSVEDLLKLMDRSGIERAQVSPLSGVFYQNAQEANEELFFEIGTHADQLMLVAACNPSYPGWEKDLKRSREVLSAVGARLFPNYHGYQLSRPEVSALAKEAGQYGMPVFVNLRLTDERHHPPAFMTPAVRVEDVIALAREHPGTPFVLSMGRFGEVVSALRETSETGNLFADIAGVQGPTRCVKKLAAEVGLDRLLFGTELMLQYALPSRLKVEFSELTTEERHRLYAGNLSWLLRLDE